MKKKYASLLIGLLAAFTFANAEEPRIYLVKPKLEVAASIQVGDTIEFSVEGVASSDASSVEFSSEVAGDKDKSTLFEWGWMLNPFAPESKASPDSASIPDGFRFLASPVKSGEITLPKMVLKNGRGEIVGHTQQWKADVVSALNAQQDKASEMRPPAAVAVPVGTIVGIVLLILLLLVLAYVGIRKVLDKKSRVKKKEKTEVILPEHEEALKALDVLMEKRYFEKSLFKPHYFGISEILKHYVARRYGFDAEEKTSRELLRHLEIEIGIKDQILDDLEKLFEKLDWVKFTDHVPDSLEALQLLNQARDWVKRTQAQPQNPVEVRAK